MDAEVFEQAKLIRETVRVLRARIVARFHSLPKTSPGGAVQAHSLTVSQLNMLSVIRHQGGTTIKDLASELHVSAPSASAMGAVTREQNPRDRREVMVSMSGEAAELIERIEEQILEGIAELLEKIGPGHARQWCDVYKRILEVIAKEKVGNSSS